MRSEGKSKGFEAWVEGREDQRRLNEYQIQHREARGDDPAYTECYLETIDEPFAIVVRKTSKMNITSQWKASCHVDGIYLGQSYWSQTVSSRRWNDLAVTSDDGVKLATLRFGPMATTDDPSKVTLKGEQLKRIGTIEIELRAGTWQHSGRGPAKGVSLKPGTAAEKAKKMGYNVIAVVQGPTSGNVNRDTYTFKPANSTAYHKFIFKYLPRVELLRIRIIEESPKPQDSATTLQRSHKRKRPSSAYDLTSPDESGGANADVKPDLIAQRIRYLEEQVRALSGENKRLRTTGPQAEDESIDLTLDQDEDDD
ncbi:hypothetical protein IAU60_000778 [Kwoniella sp. DSM 27419]